MEGWPGEEREVRGEGMEEGEEERKEGGLEMLMNEDGQEGCEVWWGSTGSSLWGRMRWLRGSVEGERWRGRGVRGWWRGRGVRGW